VSNDFGNDFITISDDDGNDFVLEHLDTIEIDETFYMAFLPTDIGEDDENYGLIILRVVEENGEDVLVSIDDDDELLESLYETFVDRLAEEDISEENGSDAE